MSFLQGVSPSSIKKLCQRAKICKKLLLEIQSKTFTSLNQTGDSCFFESPDQRRGLVVRRRPSSTVRFWHPGDVGTRWHPLGARSKKCTAPTPGTFLHCLNEVGTRWHPPRHPRVLQQVVGGSAISIIVRLSIYITN